MYVMYIRAFKYFTTIPLNIKDHFRKKSVSIVTDAAYILFTYIMFLFLIVVNNTTATTTTTAIITCVCIVFVITYISVVNITVDFISNNALITVCLQFVS